MKITRPRNRGLGALHLTRNIPTMRATNWDFLIAYGRTGADKIKKGWAKAFRELLKNLKL